MTEELYAKAKEAKSAEELLALMQENGMEDFTSEDAEELYAQMHTSGELSDEELENVSGGKVSVGGQKYKVVTSEMACFTGKWESGFNDSKDVGSYFGSATYYYGCKRSDHQGLRKTWANSFAHRNTCGACLHLGFTKTLTGYCEVEHDS